MDTYIGDEKLFESNDKYAEITISKDFIIFEFNDQIEVIVTSTYPDLINNYKDSHYIQSSAILASTIEFIDDINDYVLKLIYMVLLRISLITLLSLLLEKPIQIC